MNLEAIALARREEQLSNPRNYLKRDADEPKRLERICPVCQERPPSHPSAQICRPCRDRGFTAARCDCGNPLTRTDQTAKGSARNRCKPCRQRACADEFGYGFVEASWGRTA